MRMRFFLPSRLDIPSDWTDQQRSLMQQTVTQAFARIARRLDATDSGTEIVQGEHALQQGRKRTAKTVQQPTNRHEKRRHGKRAYKQHGSSADTEADDNGQLLDISVETEEIRDTKDAIPLTANTGFITTGTAMGDIIREAFPVVAVIDGGRDNLTYAGGSPYVKTQSLSPALYWGNALFEKSGYAILQPQGDPSSAFYTVGLLTATPVPEQAEPLVLQSGEQVMALQSKIPPLEDYTTVTVVGSDGNFFFGNTQPWNFTQFKHALEVEGVTENSNPSIGQESLSVAFAPSIHESYQHTVDRGTIDMIVSLDRDIFAAIPWEKRAEYLQLLVSAGVGERERHTILSIIHATSSESELLAIFTFLREHGVYEQLFNNLDAPIYELLIAFEEQNTSSVLNWHFLADSVMDKGDVSYQSGISPHDVLPLLQQRADTLLEQLARSWGHVKFLFDKPDAVTESFTYLPEFLWILYLAQAGEVQAQELVTQLVVTAGASTTRAINGLRTMAQTGMKQEQAIGKVDSDLQRQLVIVLLLESLVMFIATPEIRSTLQTTDAPIKHLITLQNMMSDTKREGTGEHG